MGKTRTGFVPLHSGGWFWEGGGNEKGGETEMTRQFKFIYKKRNIQEHMQITGIFFYSKYMVVHTCSASTHSGRAGVQGHLELNFRFKASLGSMIPSLQ